MAPKTATPESRRGTARAVAGYSPEVQEFLRNHPALAREMPAIEAMIYAAFDRPEIKIRVFDFAGSDEPMEPVLEIVAWCREDLDSAIRLRKQAIDGPWLELPLDAIRHAVLHLATRTG